ncbi:MAG: Hpt domain-containing protein [Ilumatobacteraceae bacterium]
MAERSTIEPQDPVAAVLADLWIKRRPELVSDLSALRARLDDLVRAPKDRVHRARATALAHRLHGAFGVFGFTAVKIRIGEIETALRNGSEITTSTVAAVETLLRELPR